MQTIANSTAQQMARGLGLFSLVLGAAELLAPGTIKRRVGMPGPNLVLQTYGVREIGTGLAILGSKRPVSMVWARVVGDLLDLATAAPVLRSDNPRRAEGVGSFAFLVMATALDVAVAVQGDRTPVSPRLRSGVRLQTRPADLPAGAAPANRLGSGIPQRLERPASAEARDNENDDHEDHDQPDVEDDGPAEETPVASGTS